MTDADFELLLLCIFFPPAVVKSLFKFNLLGIFVVVVPYSQKSGIILKNVLTQNYFVLRWTSLIVYTNRSIAKWLRDSSIPGDWEWHGASSPQTQRICLNLTNLRHVVSSQQLNLLNFCLFYFLSNNRWGEREKVLIKWKKDSFYELKIFFMDLSILETILKLNLDQSSLAQHYMVSSFIIWRMLLSPS